MTQVLKDQVFSRVPDGKVLKINDWLARTTLDVIGEGAHRVSLRVSYDLTYLGHCSCI